MWLFALCADASKPRGRGWGKNEVEDLRGNSLSDGKNHEANECFPPVFSCPNPCLTYRILIGPGGRQFLSYNL